MTGQDEGGIRIYVLGGFTIRRGKALLEQDAWSRRKAAGLLQRLALERRLHREQAIESLWPERDPDSGANNLYRTLYALRRTLDRALGSDTADQVFTFKKGILRLDESVWVDADEFERLCSQALDAPSAERRDLLVQAVDHYAGELLPDERYAEWTLEWRRRLQRRYRAVCLSLAIEEREAGEYDRAAALLTPLLADEPADEPLHRELMRIYALADRRDAALRQYEACVEALASELGVAPNERTDALHVSIRDGQFLPARIAGVGDASTAARPLFGREEELRLMTERLGNPFCRLLTLVGPGGIGKTRLALRAAENAPGVFCRVAVVRLASLSTADLLVQAIADALELSFSAAGSPKEQLLAYLREKQLLLVLDNFEHLLGATSLLSDIVTEAPGVKVLVTSRSRLNLRQEWVLEIDGLSCPDEASAADAEDHAAIQLFLHTARQVRPGFTLSDRNRTAITRICRQAGGMPLAIELAAGRAQSLPAEAIADEMSRSSNVLATTMRDMPARHRSLLAVFEESWQHLSADEQSVFARLSVFRGRIPREAAETVAGATLPVLSALVTKSRLKRTPAGRYEIHPLLRQYGYEKLRAGGEEERVLDLHDRYYAELLETMAVALRGGGEQEALARIEAGIDDIRAAWRRAIMREDLAAIDRSADGLTLFHQIRGGYQEVLSALDGAIEMVQQRPVDADSAEVCGKLLIRQASIYVCLHQYARARDRAQEGLAILRAAHAGKEVADAYRVLGDSVALQGMLQQARRHYQDSMVIYDESGDDSDIAWAHNRMGWVSVLLGDYEEAEEHLRESLTGFRELGHQRGMVGTLSDLGHLDRRRGAYRQAKRTYHEAVALSRELGYRNGTARCLCELSDVCRDLGEYRQARLHVEESLAISIELGSLDRMPALYRLGRLAILLGDYEAAERQLHDSLLLAKEAASPDGVGHALAYLGELALARGHHRKAQHRFQESLEQFARTGGHSWAILEARLGLGQADGALGVYPTAHHHLREALSQALNLPSVPHTLDALTAHAELLVDVGAKSRALELATFAYDHPASRRATRDRAQDLLSELISAWSPERAAALRERVLSQGLSQIARDTLSHSPVPTIGAGTANGR